MEETSDRYDVVIVGLGCVGLSAAYFCAKHGLKVLGLEANSCSGQAGTSSQGDTRVFSLGFKNPKRNKMMEIGLPLWRTIEKELKDLHDSGDAKFADIETQLLVPLESLVFGPLDNEYIQEVKEQESDKEWLSAEQITDKYPAIQNLTSEHIGLVSKGCGVMVQHALKGFQLMAEQFGANLIYNCKVDKISKNAVVTQDESTYEASHVVVCCGAYTQEQFDPTESRSKVVPVETLTFACDLNKLPGIIFEPSSDITIYGIREGPKLEEFKIGIHGERDYMKTIKWIKNRIPSMIEDLKYSRPCFYTVTEDKEFIYKTNPDGIHYCYGLNGEGFKFMPFHGKAIYEGLISQTDTSFVHPSRGEL